MQPRQRLRNIIGGSAGNFVEWFDWFVYASFALYFSRAFFPGQDQTVQLLNAALVFGGGFLARPLGAWLMGRYADRAGRRAALALTVGMMCGGSLMIACLPTYASIGAWAPALLLVARLIQDHRKMEVDWAEARRVLLAIADSPASGWTPLTVGQTDALTQFADLYRHHLDEEDGVAHPAAQCVLSPAAVQAMSEDMMQRRGVAPAR